MACVVQPVASPLPRFAFATNQTRHTLAIIYTFPRYLVESSRRHPRQFACFRSTRLDSTLFRQLDSTLHNARLTSPHLALPHLTSFSPHLSSLSLVAVFASLPRLAFARLGLSSATKCNPTSTPDASASPSLSASPRNSAHSPTYGRPSLASAWIPCRLSHVILQDREEGYYLDSRTHERRRWVGRWVPRLGLVS